jgi:hypothetical protein
MLRCYGIGSNSLIITSSSNQLFLNTAKFSGLPCKLGTHWSIESYFARSSLTHAVPHLVNWCLLSLIRWIFLQIKNYLFIYLFVIYFMNMSVTQTTQRRKIVWEWIMNWKGYVRNQSLSNFNHCQGLWLAGLRKAMKNLSDNSVSWPRFEIDTPCNARQKSYRLVDFLGT